MKPVLYILEDGVSRGWHPFSLTRPVGEILFGTLLLRERIERTVGASAAGYLVPDGLAGFAEEGVPPVLALDSLPTEAPRLIVSSRYVPPNAAGGEEGPPLRIPESVVDREHRLMVGSRPAGWYIPAGMPLPATGPLTDAGEADSKLKQPDSPESGAPLPLPGQLLESPWELLEANPARLGLDLADGIPGADGDAKPLQAFPQVHQVGDDPVTMEADVVIDPFVVLDTRKGPIHLAAGVQLRSFTILRGPAFIGPHSALLGGEFESLGCGPVCRLRGELSSSVVLGYSNKAHDGYVGHSLLGRWVNLGAFTTNSDLKNNYGSVRAGAPSGEVETGLLKVGVFIGDHAKTGIGTLLNAGTVVGAGSNIYGGSFPWKWIPPFGWGTAAAFGPHRLEPFLATVERAMERRGMVLTTAERDFLSSAWRSVHTAKDEAAVR